jgi:hypothetical protein
MTDPVFAIILELFMISDPWPLEEEKNATLEAALNEMAQERGFENWVAAYHQRADR